MKRLNKEVVNMSSLIGFIEIVLLVVLITLKMTGLINWSWWAVLWPLWFDIAIGVLTAIHNWINDPWR